MPKASTIIDTKGSRKSLDRPHAPVFYSENTTRGLNDFKGKWNFKRRFGVVFGLLPWPMRFEAATWETTKDLL